MNASLLPPRAQAYVRGHVLRGRRLAAVRGVGTAAASFLAASLACGLADRFVHFSRTTRGTMLTVAVAVAALSAARPLLRLVRGGVDWLAAADDIEARTPRFAQRLATLTSQMLGRAEHRGSDELLDRLARDVDRQAAGERPAALLPARAALKPWAAALALSAAGYGLTLVPELNMPRLALRFVAPWRDVDPVTTTQLAVRPGSLDLPQGAPAHIEATVERLGNEPVWLHLSDGPAGTWRRFPMTASLPAPGKGDADDGPVRFGYALNALDRDARYYVAAGDATSRTFDLRVLRRPAVADVRARYTYPAYTGRPPADAVLADGRIEAPTGTAVELTVVATEPLQSALFGYAGEKRLMERVPDDATGRSRRTRFVVGPTGKYELDLISTREQAGSGPPTAEVRAVTDRPPTVRSIAANQTLRLGPRDVVPLAYEAADDFGVESLALRVQVNAGAPQDLALSLAPSDDRRRRDGTVEFDPTPLQLTVGDVVGLTLIAKDTAGAVGNADPVYVLVSPRAVGWDAYERAMDLESAAQSVETAVAELEAAAAALAEGDTRSTTRATGQVSGRASRRFSAASGSAGSARRSIVRALARDPSPTLAAAMVAWIDQGQVLASSAEGLFREMGGGGDKPGDKPSPRSRADRPMLADAARELAGRATGLQKDLWTAARGERAAAVLADLENLAAAEKRLAEKPVPSLRQSVQRLKDEIAAVVKSLGVPAGSGKEQRERLKRLADEGQYVAKARPPADYVAAAREWSQQVRRNEWRPLTFVDRLLAAAAAEAVRPGGDARVAGDFNLAARAAAAIVARGDRSLPIPVSAAEADGFAAAFASLVDEHRLPAAPPPTAGPAVADEQAAEIRWRAEAARRLLAERAGDADGAAGRPATVPAAVARDRRRPLRPHDVPDAAGPLHGPDPPAYEAAIKAYLEAVNKPRP